MDSATDRGTPGHIQGRIEGHWDGVRDGARDARTDQAGRNKQELLDTQLGFHNGHPYRAGRAFSAGGDTDFLLERAFKSTAEVNTNAMFAFYSLFMVQVRRLKVPVVAAINGTAIGAGFTFALSADIHIIAEEDHGLYMCPCGGLSASLTYVPQWISAGMAVIFQRAVMVLSRLSFLFATGVKGVCAVSRFAQGPWGEPPSSSEKNQKSNCRGRALLAELL